MRYGPGRHYAVQGRYDYYAIDLYIDDGLRRMVHEYGTKKLANLMAGEMNDAYEAGKRDGAKQLKSDILDILSKKIYPHTVHEILALLYEIDDNTDVYPS
jgi:hypothetical protein